MSYQPEKDKMTWVLEQAVDVDDKRSCIRVARCSYDGGEEKIALQRPNARFVKLGRLTRSEGKLLHHLLGRALEAWDVEDPVTPTKTAEPKTDKKAGGKKKRRLGNMGKYSG